MYEKVMYEDILLRMLDRVPDTMDKREGSVIYDALAPAAIELQLMYIELDTVLNETFADAASREYLIRRAAERGIEPMQATSAVLTGEFTPDGIELSGKRFSIGNLNYIVLDKIDEVAPVQHYRVKCETVGNIGNENFGAMIPIEYIQGLKTASLTAVLVPGEDEEDTESIRTRYFNSFNSEAFGGNVADYLNKTNSIPGVGSTKVEAAWEGGGTVLLTILNAEYSKASDTLIQNVQNIIDPSQDGEGIGIAPIGHIVTVKTAEEIPITVESTIIFSEGQSYASMKEQLETTMKEYLLNLRKDWSNQEYTIVRIAQIESRFMLLDGILDIGNTKINGKEENFALGSYQIPVFGGVVSG